MATLNDDSWIGRRIDQYQVLSRIGAGGMGVVYRARDTKLGRDIALKVLPAEFSSDPESIARAEREARLLASLNHPNIAAIYDLKECEGNLCLVLEYVEGDTLAERLKRGALAVNDGLTVCLQIAEALGAAHRAGVIHRDIKPANVKVTPEGRVKVLDFGLAKAITPETPELDMSETPTLLTQVIPEAIRGTPAYMSPEQVRGELVDNRTDIWGFGCVLFELLSGRQPFSGATIPDLIASVLKTDPDWSALPQDTPSRVRSFIQRCLQKETSQRLQDITLALVEIQPGTGDPEKSPRRDVSAGKTIRSLAVLPFVNAGGNPDMDYLSDGLTESIIVSLSQLPRLRVIARSAVFRYKGNTDAPQKIGRELGVAAVLTGRVLQRNDTLVISAEMVDVENGWQLWGDQYRKKAEDIFTIEEEIAKEISEQLRLKLTPEKENLLSKRYTENVEAYHLYLKGRFHWGKRTAEGLHRAIQYFRQAIEGDPTYALAYAGLAEGYVPLGFYCHLAPSDALPKARSAAEKALEIDPHLPEAVSVLASIKAFYDWEPAEGEKLARAAIKMDPKYARARQVLTECLMVLRRPVEGLAEIKRALDLDPLSLHLNAAVSMMYHFAGQHEEAADYGRKTVELDSNFFPGYFYLGLAYSALRQHSEAVEALQKATALSNNSTLMLAALGGAFAFCGKDEEARKVLGELQQLRQRKYVSQIFVAAIHAGLGENDPALVCLEKAYDDRDSWLLRCLITDPRFDKLRGKARFRKLARRIGV
jgi:serine/threonine protein kinase/tetratricopeptide (TPR) repeat protein